MKPTVRFIVSSTEFIEGNFCGIFAQSQDCGLSDPDKIEWTIRPSSVPKPPVTLPNTPPVKMGKPKLIYTSFVINQIYKKKKHRFV